VSEADLQQRILDAYGIRVEPEMVRYVLRRLSQAGSPLRELPVIGGNARTGMPVRMLIDPSNLTSLPAAAAVVS